MFEFLLPLKMLRADRKFTDRFANALRFEFLESRHMLSGESPLNLEDWQSAIFDDGVTGTLPFEFSRDQATIDPDGTPVAADEARYGDEELLTDQGAWTQQLSNLGTNTVLLASGWDHDGQTPLAVLWSVTTRKMTFVRGYDFTVARVLQLPTTLDLLNGQVSGYRYIPQAGIAHEGLVVVMLQRERREGTGWRTEGVSFAYTQDLGQTFQRVAQVGGGYDVPAIAGGVTDGMQRGRSWSFANAFPEKSADDVLGAWFPWTDYLQKSGAPKGGQVGLFRARRAAVGEPWVVEANRTIYEDWHLDDSGGLHAHTAGMFVDGMVSFWGDVAYRNRMVRHVAADLENYTTTTWTHEVEFHGGWSPDDAKVYNLGNQATSAAPGPVFGEILVAGDEQVELMMKVQRPEALGEKAIITNLHGSFPGVYRGAGFAGRISQSFRYLRGVGYVVTELSTVVDGTTGLFYSPDGEHWAQLVDLGSNKYFYGNEIIAVSGTSLYSLDVPTNHSATAPLLLNPGGQNLANSDPVQTATAAAGNTARRVLYVGGVYVYQDTLEPLDVQPPGPPPVMDGMPMWEFTATTGNRVMGAWELGNILSESDQLHWLSAWHYSLDGNGIGPSFRVGDKVNTERESVWVANSQWVPTQNFGIPNGATPVDEQRIRMMNGSTGAPRRWLTAIEGYVQGDAPTYPLAPGANGADELASVLLHNITSSWSTALTFGLSELSSFSTHFDPVGTDTIHTLASVYESDSQHIDVTFTRTSTMLGVISVDVYSGGVLVNELDFENIYFDREDQMRLVLSNSPNELGVTLLVTRGTYGIVSKTTEGVGASFVPNQIRLSNASQTVVAPMEWYAIQFSPTQALSTEQREIMISQDTMFTRLDEGSNNADFDGDQDTDGRDFLIWQRNYGITQNAQREDGDANSDGRVDGQDLEVWQLEYGAGTQTATTDADFNQDNAVDGDDLATWQAGYGITDSVNAHAQGDGDFDGDVDGRDFLTWQREFSGSQSSQVAAIQSATDDSKSDHTPSDAGQLQSCGAVTNPVSADSTESATETVFAQSSESGDAIPIGAWIPGPPLAIFEAAEKIVWEPQLQELVLVKKYSAADNTSPLEAYGEDIQLISGITADPIGSVDWGVNADLAMEQWRVF